MVQSSENLQNLNKDSGMHLKKSFQFEMEYDRSDSFHFAFEPKENPFSIESKEENCHRDRILLEIWTKTLECILNQLI